MLRRFIAPKTLMWAGTYAAKVGELKQRTRRKQSETRKN